MKWVESLHDKVFHDTKKLFEAAKEGDEEKARKVIKYADVNARNKSGETPLSVAARKGHVEIVKLLLQDPRTDVNARDEDGETPLFAAVRKGRVEIVKLLLQDPRTDPNIPATPSPDYSPNIDRDTYPPLVWVLRYADHYDVDMWRPPNLKVPREIAKLLISDPRTDVNARSKKGDTALEEAAWLGEVELVEMLLKRGADPNLSVNDKGSIALIYAIQQVTPTLQGYLAEEAVIAWGVEMNSKNGVRMVKMLLDAGAKVTPKTLEVLEKHKEEEEKVLPLLIHEAGLPDKLKRRALEDLEAGVEEVRKMLIERLEKEKSLPSIREEGQKTKVYS